MGRAILIVVVLVSTIYAGIIINVQREMYKLPEVIVWNFLHKDAENVNDYALRAAVRLGTESYILQTGVDTMTVNFTGYRQGNSEIKQISYRRLPQGFYEATTHIYSTMMGKSQSYSGQIAYQYLHNEYGGPVVLYNEYNQQTHANQTLPDQSEHPDGPMPGLVCTNDTFQNIVKYSPLGLDKYFDGGGGTHKCLEFGAAQPNGRNGKYGWVQTPDPNAANYSQLIDRLSNYEDMTIAIYAIPQRQSQVPNEGVLYWMASDPYNSRFDQPGYTRPSVAIYYDSYNASTQTVTMRYRITVDDTTAYGTPYELSKPGVRIYGNYTQGVWRMFTIVFDRGVFRAYFDTQLVGSMTIPGVTRLKPNDYGFTLGMKDIRVDGNCPTQTIHGATNYMGYNGLMDQISFWDRPLSAQQVENWFNDYVDRSQKYYIRD